MGTEEAEVEGAVVVERCNPEEMLRPMAAILPVIVVVEGRVVEEEAVEGRVAAVLEELVR